MRNWRRDLIALLESFNNNNNVVIDNKSRFELRRLNDFVKDVVNTYDDVIVMERTLIFIERFLDKNYFRK